MHLEWTVTQQRAYEDMLAAVGERLGASRQGATGDGALREAAWKACGDLGLLGLAAPPASGGGGYGALDTAHLLEAFGRACPDMGLVFASAAHLLACVVPLSRFASEALRDELLPGLASGRLVGANAMTEADAGSDIAAVGTTAEASGGGYLLNGEKSFVSNGPVADVLLVYAKTDPGAGHLGLTAFAVPAATPGVRAGEALDKLGLHGCPACTVSLEDCWVPAGNVLAHPGDGAAVFALSMAWERACLPAAWLGATERLLERCVDFARHRRSSGRALRSFQAVRHQLADMRARVEAARWLLYRACWLLDAAEGEPDTDGAVAIAKLTTSEAVLQSALDAVELFGGRGYLEGEGIAEMLRDAVPASIVSGTSNIQREIAAGAMGL